MGRACSPVHAGTIAQPALSFLAGFGPAFTTTGLPTRQLSYEPPSKMQVQSSVCDYGMPMGGSLRTAVYGSDTLRRSSSASISVSSMATVVAHRQTSSYANLPASIPAQPAPQHGSLVVAAGGSFLPPAQAVSVHEPGLPHASHGNTIFVPESAMRSRSPVVNGSKRVEVEALATVSASNDLAQLQLEVQRVKKESSEKDLRIVKLQQELSVANETLAQTQRELDFVRADALSTLSLERKSLEQAEAVVVEVAIAMQAKRAAAEADRTVAEAKSRAGTPHASVSAERQSRRASPPSVPSCKFVAQSKDDIDMLLHQFLDQTDCILSFRRMNKGWYAFQHPDDPTTSGASQCVELSIVNGKLMAKIEADRNQERAWNNGKRGSMERFVAAFS